MALQESEKRYRRLFESAKDGILILDAVTGKVVDVNPFLMQLLGYSYDTICGKHIWEIGAFKDIAASKDAFKTLQDNEYIRYEDLPLETLDGRSIAVEFVSNVYLVDHCKVIQCNVRDISAKKHGEAERKRLMAAIEQTGEAIVITDSKGVIQFVNPAFEKTTGFNRMEAVGHNSSILKSGKQDELFYRNLWDAISSGTTWSGCMVNKRKDGTLYTEEMTISPVLDTSGHIVNYVAVKRDITAHLRLMDQFQQTHKMEAVGLLAGGVAHDFNNMLTVILGYSELALMKADPTQTLHADIEEIIKAAKRSSEITRQLLAFARKQIIKPVVFDLNRAVESMLNMIRRLIGENISLEWLPEGSPCLIRMDEAQVDQILANLCVNARDAISDVGKVTIKTETAVFDEDYCIDHAEFAAGKYAMLEVSDNGFGMDKETLDQIFEPFFTRKGLGRGTGLGLSVVYGIVKQNSGFIKVSSEQGKGTTFKIYLPLSTDKGIDAPQEIAEAMPLGRGETVLVVEDEPGILKLCNMMLHQLGYKVITAATPDNAIRLATEYVGKIDILITDIIMPEMNGRNLAARIQSLFPGIKVLFMSGYTADVITQRGVLEGDINFILKPFSMRELAIKVRDVMQPNGESLPRSS
ncbi:MAG: PAS domain S-box protein [Candidatus Riflebacteria bacterium]|nr:PAS domain S-box protein [Candidatus Riflebacteria bacterium]